ncbi:NTP transferase domain-containing protein [Candidatus Dependentiae bacterium]|nr:NTP transferase domain-containing protein [Candidatus Dependentiae bacterium]
MKKITYAFSILLTLFTSTQTIENLHGVVLAAGKSRRFNTDYSKLSAPICGLPMILHVISPLAQLDMPITLVVGYKKEIVADIITKAKVPNVFLTEQQEQLGTGHALLCAIDTLQADNIMVVNGDMPLVSTETIQALYDKHIETDATISIVTSYCVDPNIEYGRIVEHDGKTEVIEAKHFTYDIHDYPYVNAGIYLISRDFLEKHLQKVQQNSVTGEFYITDLVKIASDNNHTVATIAVPFETIHGVNTLKQLAHVEHMICNNIIESFMNQGVRFIKPDSIHLDVDVTIGKNTIIHPGVHIYNGTTIGKNCIIKPFVILDGVIVPDNTTIDAYSNLVG